MCKKKPRSKKKQVITEEKRVLRVARRNGRRNDRHKRIINNRMRRPNHRKMRQNFLTQNRWKSFLLRNFILFFLTIQTERERKKNGRK
nr:MAG TPA: hypothetical protein [Caudoviricetes sp.]